MNDEVDIGLVDPHAECICRQHQFACCSLAWRGINEPTLHSLSLLRVQPAVIDSVPDPFVAKHLREFFERGDEREVDDAGAGIALHRLDDLLQLLFI